MTTIPELNRCVAAYLRYPHSKLVLGNSPLIRWHRSLSMPREFRFTLISFSKAILVCCKSRSRSSDSSLFNSRARIVCSSSPTSSINLKLETHFLLTSIFRLEVSRIRLDKQSFFSKENESRTSTTFKRELRILAKARDTSISSGAFVLDVHVKSR